MSADALRTGSDICCSWAGPRRAALMADRSVIYYDRTATGASSRGALRFVAGWVVEVDRAAVTPARKPRPHLDRLLCLARDPERPLMPGQLLGGELLRPEADADLIAALFALQEA